MGQWHQKIQRNQLSIKRIARLEGLRMFNTIYEYDLLIENFLLLLRHDKRKAITKKQVLMIFDKAELTARRELMNRKKNETLHSNT